MQAETSYKTSIFVVICGPEWDIDGYRLWDMGPHYLGQSELRWDSHIKMRFTYKNEWRWITLDSRKELMVTPTSVLFNDY